MWTSAAFSWSGKPALPFSPQPRRCPGVRVYSAHAAETRLSHTTPLGTRGRRGPVLPGSPCLGSLGFPYRRALDAPADVERVRQTAYEKRGYLSNVR